MMKLLEEKCALITGGGRGIGRAIALDFARNGANIAVSSRTKEELEIVVEEIESYGTKGYAIPADHSTIEGVQMCVKEYLNKFNRCDILVANAGMTHFSTVVEFPLVDAVKLFNLNVIGTYTLIKEILPSMIKEKKGTILITSSVQGNVYFVNKKVAYSASKAALTALGKSLQSEVKKHNISVNVILPGAVNTKMMEYLLSQGQRSGSTYPPEYISLIYLFLASKLAKKKYQGKVINQQELFSGLNAVQEHMSNTSENYKNALNFLKEYLNKDIYSLLSRNSELAEFLLKQDVEFHSTL
jgi:NAD(P)-dependent dehydrogenase (short-subunit alcohol dehydrogenase family)